MAYEFDFDSANRILRCTLSGEITEESLMDFYRMAALLVESLDPLAGITDMSAVTSFENSPQAIRNLAKFPPAMPEPSRPRVIIASTDYTFGMARIFEIEGEATRPSLHVVRSVAEAWAILRVREPAFESVHKILSGRFQA